MTSIYFTPEILTPEGFEDPFDPTDPRPPGHVLAYALILLVIIVLIGFDIERASEASQSQLTAEKPQDCMAIDDQSARLDCYDAVLHRNPPQPAKGANAVLSNRP